MWFSIMDRNQNSKCSLEQNLVVEGIIQNFSFFKCLIFTTLLTSHINHRAFKCCYLLFFRFQWMEKKIYVFRRGVLISLVIIIIIIVAFLMTSSNTYTWPFDTKVLFFLILFFNKKLQIIPCSELTILAEHSPIYSFLEFGVWNPKHNRNYVIAYSVQGNIVNDKHCSFSRKTLTFLKMNNSWLKIIIFLLKTVIKKKKMLTFKKINLYNIMIVWWSYE